MYVASTVELLQYFNQCLVDVRKFFFGRNKFSLVINIFCNEKSLVIITGSGMLQRHVKIS
jgi:hypothetical protein